MLRFIKRLIKLVIILAIVAVIFNFHYRGKSARQYAKDYGWKVAVYLYEKGKWLIGKDLEDLSPKSLPSLKEIGNTLTKKEEIPLKKTETQKDAASKTDELTPQDREKLTELLKQKSKQQKALSQGGK